MIAEWMAYALVIAALVSVAALIGERIAILRRFPSRWICVAALLSSLFLPVLCAWNDARLGGQTATTLIALAAQDRPPVYERSPIAWVGGDSAVVARRVTSDVWLLTGWAVLSALALVTLTIGWMQLRRRLGS